MLRPDRQLAHAYSLRRHRNSRGCAGGTSRARRTRPGADRRRGTATVTPVHAAESAPAATGTAIKSLPAVDQRIQPSAEPSRANDMVCHDPPGSSRSARTCAASGPWDSGHAGGRCRSHMGRIVAKCSAASGSWAGRPTPVRNSGTGRTARGESASVHGTGEKPGSAAGARPVLHHLNRRSRAASRCPGHGWKHGLQRRGRQS